jgi:Cu(I)/Ag(I) efflux system membrane protein CusA/SilA
VHFYEPILTWALEHKVKFLLLPVVTLMFGALVWLGFDTVFGPVATGLEKLGCVCKR